MAYNNDYFLEEIRQKADIIEVISSYVKLRRQGKNYLGLCPFHQEKTPSFNVNREKQLYYCFGCGAGGDAFNFLMEIENLPFMEAAKLLAERYNVPIPDKPMTKARRKSEELKEQLFEIHEWAAKFYHYLLLEHGQGKAALEYFEKRGFTRATIEKFRLGSAPQGWTALFHFLKKKGYSDRLLEQSGLILPRKNNGYYDRFRDRAIFTIFNLRGQPIGFGGRVMQADQQPKYLNSPETKLFEKNQNLYGLNFAKDAIRLSKQAIMVEGYTDVITAHQYGVENVIASLGTALTENQARLLARYAEEVYIAYDADTAGQNATLRGLDILKEAGLIVKVIKLPDATDPDELIREEGKEKFLDLLDHSVSLVDFKLRQILDKHDLDNPDGKVKVVQELLPLFLNIDNAIEKDYLIGQIVEGVHISREAIEEELEKFIQKNSQIKDRSDKFRHTREESKESQQVSTDPKRTEFERKFIHGLLRMPDLLGRVFSEITPIVFQNRLNRLIMEELYKYYQREDRPDLSTLTTNHLLEIFPEDDHLNKQVMKIIFYYQELEITESFVVEGLIKLKGYQKAMEMETLRREINHIKDHGNLPDLNQMLIRYHRLLHQESGKEGC